MTAIKSFRYPLRIYSVSVILIMVSFFLVPYAVSELQIRWQQGKLSRQLAENTGNISRDLIKLTNEISTLRRQLTEIDSKKQPELPVFTDVADHFGLRIIGVSSRSGALKDRNSARTQTLVFRGTIQSSLDALHYIENMISVNLESVSLSPSVDSPNLIDLALRYKAENNVDENRED